MLVIEIIGWTGSALILTAYALLSIGKLAARSSLYQLMNILGALGMAINGWAHGAFPSVANNLIWAVIGGVALVRLLTARRA